jgi:hypothetical protein
MQLTLPMFKRFFFLPFVQRIIRISQNKRLIHGHRQNRAASDLGVLYFPSVKTG